MSSGAGHAPVTFGVKRWAGRGARSAPFRAASSFVEPSPKRPAVPSIPVVDRWQDGRVAGLSDFPWQLQLGSGIPPPSIFRGADRRSDLPLGGLQFDPPPLRVHSPGLVHITEVPVRLQVAVPAISGPVFASPVALALPASDPILGFGSHWYWGSVHEGFACSTEGATLEVVACIARYCW